MMVLREEIEHNIESLLTKSPYSLPPEEKHSLLLALFKDELEYACDKNQGFGNYLRQWPFDFHDVNSIADLPYLPVGVFKANPPLSLIETTQIKRTLTSSSTTGQIPSRIVLDASTARRMTKGVIAIAQDFIGAERRPYLVVDVPESVRSRGEMGARGAAIQGLQTFAKEVFYCLHLDERGELKLDLSRLMQFVQDHKMEPVLVYGFTYILWNCIVKELEPKGICLDMPNIYILHSGGWKRLQEQAVEKSMFNHRLAKVFGCSENRIIDFYGMVENVGIIYPDCPQGYKHVPTFGHVTIRNPLTLEPVNAGERGVVQVCSVLPTSFPGYLLLTEDMAEVIGYDGCSCGRRDMYFRFVGRIPKSEVRGCGNINARR